MIRRNTLVTGIACLGAAAVLGVFVVVPAGAIVAFDDTWHLWMDQWRSPALIGFAMTMNSVGGGWTAIFLVPLVFAGIVLCARGWRAAVFVLASFLASALVVQAIKHLLGRVRPQDLLVVSDFGSFPSGHTANAAVIAVMLFLIFPGVLTAIGGVLWVTAMAFSRTVLSAHWISDTVGGVFVGVGMVLIVAAAMWSWIGSGREERMGDN